jgi:hypothetical protein
MALDVSKIEAQDLAEQHLLTKDYSAGGTVTATSSHLEQTKWVVYLAAVNRLGDRQTRIVHVYSKTDIRTNR